MISKCIVILILYKYNLTLTHRLISFCALHLARGKSYHYYKTITVTMRSSVRGQSTLMTPSLSAKVSSYPHGKVPSFIPPRAI